MSTLQFGKSVSTFDKFYTGDNNEMQVMVDTAFADLYKEAWWRTAYTKADMPTPIDAYGRAKFTVAEIVTTSAPMALPRAKWTPPAEGNHEGFDTYSDSLWDYGYSFSTSAQQRDYYSKMLDKFNGNTTILSKYISSTSDLVKGINATLTYTGASLLSQGYYVTPNEGLKATGRAKIPADRFKKAGAKTWDDPSADILTKMQMEVKEFRDKTQFQGALSFKMDKTTFGYLQTNTKIREQVGNYIISLGNVFSTNSIVTVERFNQYIAELGQYTFVVELVEEKQLLLDGTINRKDVRGWKVGNVVLSPIGMQGTIEYADVDEIAILANVPNRQVAYMEGGLFGIMNWISEGRSPVWITEILGTFAPALSVFNHITIIDTKTAD